VRRGILKSIAGLIAAAGLVGLLGCGGEDEVSLTKAQFVKKGNEICLKSEKERLAVLEETAGKLGVNPGRVPSQSTQQKVILAGIPSYEEAAQKLGEIAPDGEEEKVEAMVEAMEEAADKVRADPGTALVSGIQFENADKLLEAYGLENCAV